MCLIKDSFLAKYKKKLNKKAKWLKSQTRDWIDVESWSYIKEEMRDWKHLKCSIIANLVGEFFVWSGLNFSVFLKWTVLIALNQSNTSPVWLTCDRLDGIIVDERLCILLL